jgi:hypothetical protein
MLFTFHELALNPTTPQSHLFKFNIDKVFYEQSETSKSLLWAKKEPHGIRRARELSSAYSLIVISFQNKNIIFVEKNKFQASPHFYQPKIKG